MKTLATPVRAREFHALADETRLLIVDLLASGERCVCELTEALDIRQSLLSFHLRTLKEAGVIRDRREGRWIFYRLEREALRTLAGALTGLAERRPEERTPGGRCGPSA